MTIELTDIPRSTDSSNGLLRAGEFVGAREFSEIRNEFVLEHCKWDPQVQDVATLADFPLILPKSQWIHLSQAAEELTAETIELERALVHRPELHTKICLPHGMSRMFAMARHLTPAACRVMRFDFHPTPNGWRVSEVNSDVPGGFAEASALPAMMQSRFPFTRTPGDPAAAYVDALARDAASSLSEHVVLLSAAGFMEDHQVVAGLAARLRERGLQTHLAQPEHLRWINDEAYLESSWFCGRVGCIVRFFQAEWLSHLPHRSGWQRLFVDGATPVANPGTAILTESKRLPLVWDQLNVPLRAWPRFLPETRKPSKAPWRTDENWLLKTAFCNTGDSVTVRSMLPPREWRKRWLDIWLHSNQWLAQRRFDATSILTPRGEMFPCIGVYTIDGKACGGYGRLSSKPVIDYSAVDVAVLIEQETEEDLR